ncbi:MAG: T9SS type A sorting domain-containing protein, partial [Crocinitomicaceae bacterium]
SNPNSGQFITKITSGLGSVVYSTVFGNGAGIPNVSPAAFAIDDCENVFVSAWGSNIIQALPLNGMPVTTNAIQQNPANGFDFYLFVLERDAESLMYGSYIGGDQAREHVDGGTSRFDENGVLYQSVCGGCGGYSDFNTTTGAWSNSNLSTNCNNLVFKFDFQAEKANFELSQNEGCIPFTVNISNLSTDTVNFTWIFPAGVNILSSGVHPQLEFDSEGTYNISLVVSDPFCSIDDTLTLTVNGYAPSPILDVSNDTTLLQLSNVNLLANSYGTATNFTWADNIQFNNPLNSGAMDSIITVNPITTTTYYVLASSGSSYCEILDSVTITIPANVSTEEEGNLTTLIYPNPFDETLSVESSKGMKKVELFDNRGRLVYTNEKIDPYSSKLDVSRLPKSTYLISITYLDESVYNVKIIK